MKRKSGVALAVLMTVAIITIILASVGLRIIINRNYFKKGDDMQYNSNYENYKLQLEDYIGNKQFETNSKYNEYDLFADKNGVYYKGVKQGELTIKDIIPAISQKDLEYVKVENGKLVFNNPN